MQSTIQDKIVTRSLKAEEVPFDEACAYKFLKSRKGGGQPAQVQRLLEDLRIRYLHEFEPCYRYRVCQIHRVAPGVEEVELANGTKFCGRGIFRRLKNSRHVAAFLATLGPKVDARLQNLGHKRPSEAFFLSAIAATILQGVLQLLTEELEKIAARQECKLTRRFSPGYRHWDLSQQKILLDLLDAGELGVRLTEGFFIIPGMSISGVIGFFPVAKHTGAT